MSSLLTGLGTFMLRVPPMQMVQVNALACPVTVSLVEGALKSC